MDAHNVRRTFRRVVEAAGLDPTAWTPRELRHGFVSLLSEAGVPLEQISRLVGHNGTRSPEAVCRKQLKPVVDDPDPAGSFVRAGLEGINRPCTAQDRVGGGHRSAGRPSSLSVLVEHLDTLARIVAGLERATSGYATVGEFEVGRLSTAVP
jgi:integrase-like protein